MSVSFKTLDLNLLKVFDAVMEERSVLRASQKVALSQSAVSHSLARLREMLEDDLFVRTASADLVDFAGSGFVSVATALLTKRSCTGLGVSSTNAGLGLPR